MVNQLATDYPTSSLSLIIFLSFLLSADLPSVSNIIVGLSINHSGYQLFLTNLVVTKVYVFCARSRVVGGQLSGQHRVKIVQGVK